MRKAAWLAIILLAALGGWRLWFSDEKSPTITVTSSAILAEDLYPLYTGAEWSNVEAENFMIGTDSYSGASASSAPIDAGMNPASIFTPFERYYDAKLKALGWSVANDLAAGGHVGGQTGYRKESVVVLVRFSIDYKMNPQDAPSECPCEVTLSVFSSER